MSSESPLKGKSILVVDDEPDVLETVGEELDMCLIDKAPDYNRDTLRLEAGLSLYGHELGLDPEGKEIPVCAVPSAMRLALSFSNLKGEFIGRESLRKQFEEVKAREEGLPLPAKESQRVPRRILPLLITGQGIARAGHGVFMNGVSVGTVTSGTMVPYWIFSDKGILSDPTDEKKLRPIALAYIDSDLEDGERVEFSIGGRHSTQSSWNGIQVENDFA